MIKRISIAFSLALLVVIAGGYWYVRQTPKLQFQSMEWVKNYNVKPGTDGMIELLDSIYRWDKKRKDELHYKRSLKKLIYNLYNAAPQKLKDAKVLLHEGETNQAIQILEELMDDFKDDSDKLYTKYHELLAIAYLRWGEQENCIVNHNNNSCILPIKENGIYTLQENTRKAIDVYLKLLEKHPNDWRYRWLVNIAYQTLGEYPESVPQEWLIQSDLMQDKSLSDNFTNIAPSLNVGETSGAGGALLEDFNNDGSLDIITSGLLSNNSIKYYINHGKDGFTDQTKSANLEGLTSGFNVYPLDFNNDGWMDLFVTRGSWGGKNGLYPKPYRISDRTVAWKVEDVLKLIEDIESA